MDVASPVNRFRKARGAVLASKIGAASEALGRAIHVLDVGGRPDYWENVGMQSIEHVTLLNYNEEELQRGEADADRFSRRLGDARDLSDFADASVDFVHSNSVIEHVGSWDDMSAMASELQRVGRFGWVQTPAWEFPIEPHFRAPFMHWFGKPLQRKMFVLSVSPRLRKLSFEQRRQAIDRVNLLSRAEVCALFPGKSVFVERVIFAKSYSVYW